MLCTLHKIEGKTLYKMTIDFFLKVLDKMLDLCYTNNAERFSCGYRTVAVQPSGWRAVKHARLVRKQWQSRNPAPLTREYIEARAFGEVAYNLSFFYSPRRLLARRRDFRILCTLHKFESKTLCNLTIDFFRKGCYTYYRK